MEIVWEDIIIELQAFARYLTQTIRFNTVVESVRSGSWTQTVVGNNP